MSSDVDAKTLSYEAEVAPRWAEPFARLLLNVAPIDPKAMVLDVLCGTGSTAIPLLERLEQRGRVVALDPSSARLAIARRKAGSVVGKRLFFRHEKLERFSFTDDVFDVVLSNAGVLELAQPLGGGGAGGSGAGSSGAGSSGAGGSGAGSSGAGSSGAGGEGTGLGGGVLSECIRVAKPGGTLAMTVALRGTFQELFDFFREVLERREDEAALKRLDAHILSYPGDDEALSRYESLGLGDVTLSRSTFPVEFPSARALFTSELAQQLFLEKWTAVAGPESQAIFRELASTIDTYLGADPVELTVQAACLVGRKATYRLEPRGMSMGSTKLGASTAPVEPAPSDEDLAADEVTPVRSVSIPMEAALDSPEATSTPIIASPGASARQPMASLASGIKDAAAQARPESAEIFAARDPASADASAAEAAGAAPSRKGPPPLPPAPPPQSESPQSESPESESLLGRGSPGSEGTGAGESTHGSSSAPGPGKSKKKRR